MTDYLPEGKRVLTRENLHILGSPSLLREAARRVVESKLKHPAAVQWIVDVDPLDSL